MTLKSHPGLAIVRDQKWNKGDGELSFVGEAADAHTVKVETKSDVHWIQSCDHKNRWMEIPCAQHEEDMVMWFRTLHGRSKPHFAWKVNEDGTISSDQEKDLVLGVGLASGEGHFW